MYHDDVPELMLTLAAKKVNIDLDLINIIIITTIGVVISRIGLCDYPANKKCIGQLCTA